MLETYSDILSVDDICKIFNIGRNTAYIFLKDGIIPSVKIRHKYFIPKTGVINYLNKISSI